MHSFTIFGQTISVIIYVYEWRLVEEWDGCGDHSCAYFDDLSWLYVVSLLLELMPNFEPLVLHPSTSDHDYALSY